MSERLTTMIVDKTARAHTLSCLHERSPQVERVVVTSGNDFIAEGRDKEVIVDPDSDFDNARSILETARKYDVDLVEVANDNPIAAGAVDLLREHGFPTVGPTQAASQIEWDKPWAREFMRRHEIATPRFEYFDSPEGVLGYLAQRWKQNRNQRFWLKAPHLQEGKGVIPCDNLDEAAEGLERIFGSEFNEPGVLVEDNLFGEEFSYYGLSDGESIRYLKSAQDNKRLREGDEGLMTGGMGAVAPALVTSGLERIIEHSQMERVIQGLAAEGRPYTGVLYLGGILPGYGPPSTVEYNARPGDPETQVIWEGIESDYIELLHAILEQRLHEAELVEDDLTRAAIVLASPGYPAKPRTGLKISGLRRAAEVPGVVLRSYAIDMDDGVPRTAGGRVVSVVGSGQDTREALERATEAAEYIGFEGAEPPEWRKDIGWRDLARLDAKE